MNEIEDGTMNKNTAKAIKVVKDYMKRKGAKIVRHGWGTKKEGSFLALYLAACGKSCNDREADKAWGENWIYFEAGWDDGIVDLAEYLRAERQEDLVRGFSIPGATEDKVIALKAGVRPAKPLRRS